MLRVEATEAVVTALDIGEHGFSYERIAVEYRGRKATLVGTAWDFTQLLGQAEAHLEGEWDVSPATKRAVRKLVESVSAALVGAEVVAPENWDDVRGWVR